MVTATQKADAASVYEALNAKSASSNKKSTVQETQDRFLKLLVTQMRNQDPLNPMDNAQVTSQMAQLSTVSGLDKVNATLQAMTESLSGNRAMQAAGMIGHGVLLEGKNIELSSGRGLAGIELPQSAEKVTIAISDKAGVLVRNVELNNQTAGLHAWAWDGKNNAGKQLDDGVYSFKVQAVSTVQDGKKVDATPLQFGTVNSVTQNKDEVTLGIGQTDGITLSQIRQIL